MLKRSQAGKKHINSYKTGKRKRQLRAKVIETGKLGKKYVEVMGAV
jgi:ribosomal protein L35